MFAHKKMSWEIGRRLKRWLHWGPLLGICVTIYIYVAITKWVIPWQSLLGSERADFYLMLALEFCEFLYMCIVIFRDPGFVAYKWVPPPFGMYLTTTSKQANKKEEEEEEEEDKLIFFFFSCNKVEQVFSVSRDKETATRTSL
jgi:hypothetical protein